MSDKHQICVWPDGTECELDELEGMLSFCSDDFEIVERDIQDKNEDFV